MATIEHFHEPGPVLSTLHTLSHLILTMNTVIIPTFTIEKNEAQRD